MVFLLYNKVLLRFLVALSGAGVGLATWQYIALSQAKLGSQGVVDAFAIISFVIAAWLIKLTAEVVDNHYVRVFACLCMLLGCIVSYRWIFVVDGPVLAQIDGGAAGMRMVTAGFWLALLVSLFMLVILVIRLVRDKQNLGRQPQASRQIDQILGSSSEAVSAAQDRSAALEPIPIDSSPIGSPAAAAAPAAPQPAATERVAAPVSKLVGLGGMYLGNEFELSTGEHSIGRADADIMLDKDNQVSRSHARIIVADDGMAVLNDNGSTNGTFLNNQKVDSIELCPGDVIRIGTSQFRVEGRS